MKKRYQTIWNHEVKQYDQISRILLAHTQVKLGWKSLLPPLLLLDYFRFKRRLYLTRKNLLLTRQLAFNAARKIHNGKDRAWEMRSIEIETKALLDKEKKGYYAPKVRRKQLYEIEILIDHYLGLLRSTPSKFNEMIKQAYPTKTIYLSFLDKLNRAEKEVMQAAISTMRKGSKKDRNKWFNKVAITISKIRIKEADHLFPKK